MSERENERAQPIQQPENADPSEGFLHLEKDTDRDLQAPDLATVEVNPATPLSTQARERTGTVEHLAARKAVPTLDKHTPEMKLRLSALRTEITRIITSLRWENQSVAETVQRLQPFLNIGPIKQWKDTLIPFLYEIDRGGALIPVWLQIIEQGDPENLPVDANPGETEQGRARRYAILMLGNYRTMGIAGKGAQTRFASRRDDGSMVSTDLAQYLGKLATDPDVSMYATQALIQHTTAASMQALIGALQEAHGWAKVDVVEGCLEFQQERFYDILLASGLEHVSGLETYVALPLYKNIPLERYLEDRQADPLLKANAALVFQYMLQDGRQLPTATDHADTLPTAFSRDFPAVARALINNAATEPTWQNAIAMHQLGFFMGRYWSEINKHNIKDARIIEPVYQVLPLMHEVERWMDGPGRDILLQALANPEEEPLIPVARTLSELRDPRAASPIIERLETTRTIKDRSHALMLGTLCDTLARLNDRRAAAPMFQLLARTVDIEQRKHLPKRSETLPPGDPHIPGSIVYAAVIHACGQLEDISIIHGVWDATRDLDPYVRTQGLDALKILDPRGEQALSKTVVREALSDPRESVVRAASQLALQYKDFEAVPILRNVIDNRPELSYTLNETLKQLID
ncbi:hypothetical protein KDA_28500 [Dictyobacter alpinus]|uniref:Uncharacterized protein n=1 Tax=Dictyobacter alpinus TaxID=2014873 RepID=A0A402B7P1_9CHLR|nr:hypothetical protein [Dictyobacter alpinus]GCE27366.1 hypothetical protein KDA_28500 [Dictyobacter alpinus]